MLRKIISSFVVTVLLSTTVFGYSGGSGTEVQPYLISTASDIQQLSNTTADWDKYFKQTGDIDLTGITDVRVGTDYSNPFAGHYDGDGYIISNYSFTSDVNYAALFGYLATGSVVENVKLEDALVNAPSSDYCALLAGNNYGTIRFCSAGGTVIADDYSAGLVARNYGVIEDCICTADVSADVRAGCLSSYTSSTSSISRSAAKGSVDAKDRVGGLVGSNSGTITDSYSTATVTATSKIGGLIGEMTAGTVMTNCYSASVVSGLLYTGVFVGDVVGGTASGSFYDGTLNYNGSTPVPGVGRGNLAGVTEKTTVEMYDETLYTDAGWDFVDAWWIAPDSYPMVAAEQRTRIIGLSGSMSFGGVDVGSSSQLTLTISNSGNSDLTVSSISYPAGFSGAWSGIIAAGGSQNVTVTFAPTQAQSYSGTIAVNSDMTEGTNTTACSGVGIGGVIAISGNLSFGDVILGASSQKTFIINNNGTGDLVVSSISYPSGFSGSWSGTIAAGGSQVVTATFSPSTVQYYSGSLIVYSDAVSGIATLACSGTGIAQTRVIALTGDLNFGSVSIGSSSQRTMTISNSGNTAMSVSSISYPAGFSGAWSGTIAAGGSQNVAVTFSPAAAQSYGGNVVVNSNATSGTNIKAAGGTGVGSVIRLTPSLNFGSVVVGDVVQRTLTIYNDGNQSMTVSGVSYPSGAYSGSFSGSVAAGGSRNVTVTFAPVTAGDYDGTITVSSNANIGNGQCPVTADAGAETRIIGLSGNTSFGDVVVGSDMQRILTISNTGNRPLEVNGVSYSNPAFSGSWSGTIAAGGSQNVTVTFAPSAAQSYSATIAVASDATSGTAIKAASGNGLAQTRIIGIGGNFIFPDTVAGESNDATMTITNTGNTAMTVSSISYPAGFSGAWSGTIAAGGSQNVTVTFAPSVQGNYGGVLTVNADFTSGSNSTVLWGVGVERIIRLTGDMDFGSVDVGSQSASTLTIHNDGNAALNVSGMLLPEDFSGSWSGTIPAGGSQNVTITFAPESEQNYNGTIIVTSDKTSGNSTIACSGLGVGGVIRLAGLLNFEDIVVGQNSQKQMIIFNDGTGAIQVSGISYPAGFSGAWSGTIAAGGSQTVNVTFSPSAMQSYGGDITVNSDATSGTNTIAAQGVGIGRVIALSGSLDFGNVDINTSSQKTLTITNNGNRTLTVSSISYPGGFSGNWSGGTIAAGGSRNVIVTFSPAATQQYGGTVTVNSDATSGTATIAASGEGVTRVIALSGNMDFGNVDVNQSSELSLLITNNGTMDLAVSSISLPSGFSGSWSGTVAAGESQDVGITFEPTAAAEYSGTITVNSDSTAGDNTIACSGVGIGGIIRLSGNIDFGNVAIGASDTATLTIYNDGTGPLEVSGISYPNAVFTGTWSGTIPVDGSQDVTVEFLPTNEQTYSGSISVGSDAVSGNNSVTVSGVGAGGVVRVAGDLDFGDVIVSQNDTKQMMIYNDGTSSLEVSSISYPSGFSGNWSGGTIAAGSSKSVTVTFAPTSAQSYGGTISVSSDATSGDGTISCQGVGINRVIALSLNDGDLGDVDVDTSSQTTLTISNNGNRAMTVLSISYPSGFSGVWSGSIPAGGSQNVTVTFSPTAATSYSGTITVNSNKTEGDNTIAISGYGVNRIIGVSGDMDFGYVKNGQSSQSTMTITNNGNRALNISGITYPDGYSGVWSGSIPAGGSQNVTVIFAPTMGKTYDGDITVNSDATSGDAKLTCFGFALAGSGLELDPYILSEDYHIEVVNLEPAAYYMMSGNINLEEYEYDGAVICEDTDASTLAYEGTPFTGSFDGNGYVISGITIDTTSQSVHYLGLFGKLASGAEVVNLTLNNVYITTGDDSRYVGGLCGMNEGGDIFNCCTDGAIVADAVSLSFGGLCGYNMAYIEASCSYADVVGGRSSLDTGGLCGTNEGTVTDCYAMGDVVGESYVGGLCGYNYFGTINTSYSAGAVDGIDFIGGFCGNNVGTVNNCMWDMEASAQPLSSGGEGRTTAQMQSEANYTSAGWDFVGETANGTNDVWVIHASGMYPALDAMNLGNPDLNDDSFVDANDLAVMSSQWLEQGSDLAADMNGDTVVDYLDYYMFARAWLAGVTVD